MQSKHFSEELQPHPMQADATHSYFRLCWKIILRPKKILFQGVPRAKSQHLDCSSLQQGSSSREELLHGDCPNGSGPCRDWR